MGSIARVRQLCAVDKIRLLRFASQVLDSIVVSIPACHAGDRGSIPRRGDNFFAFKFVKLLNCHRSFRVYLLFFHLVSVQKEPPLSFAVDTCFRIVWSLRISKSQLFRLMRELNLYHTVVVTHEGTAIVFTAGDRGYPAQDPKHFPELISIARRETTRHTPLYDRPISNPPTLHVDQWGLIFDCQP